MLDSLNAGRRGRKQLGVLGELVANAGVNLVLLIGEVKQALVEGAESLLVAGVALAQFVMQGIAFGFQRLLLLEEFLECLGCVGELELAFVEGVGEFASASAFQSFGSLREVILAEGGSSKVCVSSKIFFSKSTALVGVNDRAPVGLAYLQCAFITVLRLGKIAACIEHIAQVVQRVGCVMGIGVRLLSYSQRALVICLCLIQIATIVANDAQVVQGVRGLSRVGVDLHIDCQRPFKARLCLNQISAFSKYIPQIVQRVGGLS
ncbi:hypothetical protein HRbin14_01316 [bacterium HR14]|nr:hypothetical protein HRbin14_01316 [bacterium HR14]